MLEGVAYPALIAAGEAVDLRLLRNRREAEEAHRAGIRALLTLQVKKDLDTCRRYLALRGEMKVWSVYFGGAGALEEGLFRGLVHRLLDRDIRSRKAFEDYALSLGPTLLKAPREMLEEVEPVLRAYHETRQALAGLEAANLANRAVLGFLAEMRSELERLLPVTFLEIYDRERLPHLARYLKALQIRADRGSVHLDRDRARAAEIRPYEEKLASLLKDIAPSVSGSRARAVDDYRWMLEEYRVSLFAQGLKTPYPVSPKRLQAKIEEIEAMG